MRTHHQKDGHADYVLLNLLEEEIGEVSSQLQPYEIRTIDQRRGISMYYGGIEAGGTKFICAIADRDAEIISKVSIPTTTPEETFDKIFAFFDQYEMKAMGIGSFGPIGIDPKTKLWLCAGNPEKGLGEL